MTDRIYRFARFELHVAAGELRCGDAVVRLQDKPLLLLTALLDHPQRVVTREQLRQRMWDGRTVVDYEQGINAAMLKVRTALGDTADRPQFVETVAKRGYRFLVPVAVVSADAARGALPTSTPRLGGGRGAVAIGAAMVLGVVGFSLYEIEIRERSPTQIQSLAVLPLQDLSPEGRHAYFADGITEELTTNLAQTLPLRVISRTSVMQYKGTKKPIMQIARELDVEAIVEGSVARSGDRVSVTVQLIDAREDRHLWAEKYERRVEDILAIEAELSQAIASQVSGTLGRQRAGSRMVRRVEPQVHELYLLGRYHVNRRTARDLVRAQEYFERAVALDPAHAPAHAGLADAYALQPFYGVGAFEEKSALAVAAARRALELDSALAEAHATLGLVLVSSRDWRASAAEFRRALELNPNYASAHHWYSYYLRFANRLDEACAELDIARQLDPLSAIVNADRGEMLNAAHRYPEARASLRRALELNPGLARAHALLTVTELATGDIAAAVKAARAALALDPQNAATLAHAGYAFAAAGDVAEATRLLATLEDMAKRDINVSMYSAVVAVGLGRKEEALAALESQARSSRSVVLQGIQHWYAFEALSAEPRFQRVVAQAW